MRKQGVEFGVQDMTKTYLYDADYKAFFQKSNVNAKLRGNSMKLKTVRAKISPVSSFVYRMIYPGLELFA